VSGYDAITGETRPDGSEQLRQFATGASDVAAEYATTLQKTIGDAIERQPLLLGAIGIALGVGIASAFPPTAIEKETMGAQGSAARERMTAFVTETVEAAKTRANDVLEEVSKEAEAQGLTPAAATEQLHGVAQKVKAVATSSGEAVKTRLT
jgi:nucleotide-binding universal stress UspA family protein